MIQRSVLVTVFVGAFLLCSFTGQAITPEVTAGMAALKAAPKLTPLVKEIATVPAAVGQTLLIPLGLVETALSPLPGLTVAHGVKSFGNGLKGPFRLVGTCLKLPLTAVEVAAGAAGLVP